VQSALGAARTDRTGPAWWQQRPATRMGVSGSPARVAAHLAAASRLPLAAAAGCRAVSQALLLSNRDARLSHARPPSSSRCTAAPLHLHRCTAGATAPPHTAHRTAPPVSPGPAAPVRPRAAPLRAASRPRPRPPGAARRFARRQPRCVPSPAHAC
jgi:hypothetical protein